MEERDLFLRGLDRDLPAASSFYCYYCLRVHLLTLSMETRVVESLWAPYSERLSSTVCKRLRRKGWRVHNASPDSKLHDREVYHQEFVFEHVQMAIRLHRRNGSSTVLKAYLERVSHVDKMVTCPLEGYKGFFFFDSKAFENHSGIKWDSILDAREGWRITWRA